MADEGRVSSLNAAGRIKHNTRDGAYLLTRGALGR